MRLLQEFERGLRDQTTSALNNIGMALWPRGVTSDEPIKQTGDADAQNIRLGVLVIMLWPATRSRSVKPACRKDTDAHTADPNAMVIIDAISGQVHNEFKTDKEASMLPHPRRDAYYKFTVQGRRYAPVE